MAIWRRAVVGAHVTVQSGSTCTRGWNRVWEPVEECVLPRGLVNFHFRNSTVGTKAGTSWYKIQNRKSRGAVRRVKPNLCKITLARVPEGPPEGSNCYSTLLHRGYILLSGGAKRRPKQRRKGVRRRGKKANEISRCSVSLVLRQGKRRRDTSDN